MGSTDRGTPFLQYELWKDCSLGCAYCWNRGQPDVDKVESLKFVLGNLDDPDTLNYADVGFIGGEFFDGQLRDPETARLFRALFEKAAGMHFRRICLATSLNYDMSEWLTDFLAFAEGIGLAGRLLLCVSYDLKYRFRSEADRGRWKGNMLRLRREYPWLPLHTEMIVTQALVDAVLDGSFDIPGFRREYGTGLDFIQPASGLYFRGKKECAEALPGFFPTKRSFVAFLKKAAVENDWIDLDTFLSMELRSSKVYYTDCGERVELRDRRSTVGVDRPRNPEIKYQTGLLDSDTPMRRIVETLRDAKI